MLPTLAVLIALAVLSPYAAGKASALFLAVIFGGLRLRQLLILEQDHLEVTVIRRRRIPWSEVEGFEPGSRFRGGTQILTSSGVVNSTSPCSWWGGPAEAADIETLRRIRASRLRGA